MAKPQDSLPQDGAAIKRRLWRPAAAQWHARAATFIGKSRRRGGAARALVNVCFSVVSLGMRVGLSKQESHQVFEEGFGWAARTDDARSVGRLHQALSVLDPVQWAATTRRERAGQGPRVTRLLAAIRTGARLVLFRSAKEGVSSSANAGHRLHGVRPRRGD